ncbi:MAG: thioesterase family protein [Actinomycetota bacterium]|nr:thioesterase family protein [Actinomycetota bacterium]
MSPFVTSVGLRWTDQDAYRHVNHARVVTLLEEARIDLAFTYAAREGLSRFADGLLVARLEVDYKRQIAYRPDPLRVAMTVRDLRAASFTLHYALHDGPHAADPVAVRASTGMALYDLSSGNVRRMDADERAYLQRWSADEAGDAEAAS